MDHTVTIYSTPWCPYCKMAKAYLTEKAVPFKDIDVEADPKAGEEMMKKSGQMGIPVIDIDEKIIVGFDKPAIKHALDIKD